MARLPSPRVALAILTALNLLNYLDRFVPAAILPTIISDLKLSDAQAGALGTLFILTYALVSPVAGWLGDRHPRFKLAGLGVFVWSLATLGSGLGSHLRGAGGGARPHRRGGGQLRGHHAVAALRLL